MKKNKVLIVFLIGLSLVAGLVLVECNNAASIQCICNEKWTEEKMEGNYVVIREREIGKCKHLFCAKNWNPEKNCDCLFK